MSNKTKAEELTQTGYRKLRHLVAIKMAGGIHQGIQYTPTADHFQQAERLIDAGFIDVDTVLDLPS